MSPERPGRRMLGRSLLAALVVIALTTGGTATAGLLMFDDTVDAFREEQSKKPAFELPSGLLADVEAGEPQTILLLGSDRRYADRVNGVPSRSDTMILVRLDPDKDATAILSIPRDLKVSFRTRGGGTTFDKINGAYERGGPAASVEKVQEVMESIDGRPFPINHVVNVNFGAFRDAVDRLGCFYVDVDRRYFNDNAPPFASLDGSLYATIDVEPGYQRLCGQDSLDFVRFRHLDTDFVRAARQQHYLGQAKNQIALGQVFRDREQLLRIFGRYTDTDISSNTEVLRLIKLAVEASRTPLRRVRFRGDIGFSYVTITDENLKLTRDEFLEIESQRVRRREVQEGTVTPASPELAAGAAGLATDASLPVLTPGVVASGSLFRDGYVGRSTARRYRIRDPDGDVHRAYRLTLEAPGIGEFYGVQGTTWTDPPMLEGASETRRVGGREVMLFRDGARLRHVGFRSGDAAYWVSNTITRSLSNRQMLAIVRSLRRAAA